MTKRNTSLDFVRIIALFCVVSVHFFLNSGFYEYKVSGIEMYWMMLMRTAFRGCVPLFIILTGYLMNQKKLSGGYFHGLTKTLLIYLLASLVCGVCKCTFLEPDYRVTDALLGIFDFSTSTYAWYIEMYIGLFLMIPFLNLVWNHLDSQRNKRLLLIILCLLTAVPQMLNIYRFDDWEWWKMPSISDEYVKLFPDFWTTLAPLAYYYVGCYLKEFPLKLKKGLAAILFLVGVVVFGSYNFWRSYGAEFVWGPWQEWAALPTMVLTVLLFCFLTKISFEHSPGWVPHSLARISELCLGGYLLSCIFDGVFYARLNEQVTDVPDRLLYYFIIVPLVFVCSLAASWGLNMVILGGRGVLKCLRQREGENI